jgi:hypothetical protein
LLSFIVLLYSQLACQKKTPGFIKSLKPATVKGCKKITPASIAPVFQCFFPTYWDFPEILGGKIWELQVFIEEEF